MLSTKYKKLKNKLTTNVFFEKCCLVYDQVSVNLKQKNILVFSMKKFTAMMRTTDVRMSESGFGSRRPLPADEI